MKRLLLCTIGIISVLFLGGCFVKTSPSEDKPQQPNAIPLSAAAQVQQLTATDAAALQPDGRCGVEITPALREAFFDLVQQERWDFLPLLEYSAEAEPTVPEDFGDYVYWVLAKNLVWENYASIDHEQSADKISAEAMHNAIQTHFGLDMPTPEPGHIYKLDFDGEYYYYPASSWMEPSVWELGSLTLENLNGQIIYRANMLAYNNTSSSIEYPPENARQLISEGLEMPAPFEVTDEYQIHFTFNNNEIVYLGITNNLSE